jgi:hypothetical protein
MSANIALFVKAFLALPANYHLMAQIWVCDDGVVKGDPAVMAAFVHYLTSVGPTYGLFVHSGTKTSVIAASQDALTAYDTALECLADVADIPVCRLFDPNKVIIHLQVPYGPPDKVCEAITDHLCSPSNRLLLDRIPALPTEHAFALFKKCAGACKGMYLARLCDPSIFERAAAPFDRLVSACFRRLDPPCWASAGVDMTSLLGFSLSNLFQNRRCFEYQNCDKHYVPLRGQPELASIL